MDFDEAKDNGVVICSTSSYIDVILCNFISSCVLGYITAKYVMFCR